ncbi:hypothetical protein ABIE67_005880 [Streptomyces sp. V4I8]
MSPSRTRSTRTPSPAAVSGSSPSGRSARLAHSRAGRADQYDDQRLRLLPPAPVEAPGQPQLDLLGGLRFGVGEIELHHGRQRDTDTDAGQHEPARLHAAHDCTHDDPRLRDDH